MLNGALPYLSKCRDINLNASLKNQNAGVKTFLWEKIYRQSSNIRRALVGIEIVDHSDVVGASPVGAAPTTSSFST